MARAPALKRFANPVANVGGVATDPPFIPAADISGAAGSINSYLTYDLVGREIFLALHAAL